MRCDGGSLLPLVQPQVGKAFAQVADLLEHLVQMKVDEQQTAGRDGRCAAFWGMDHWIVYLARHCDNFQVKVGAGLVGRDLYDHLKSTGTLPCVLTGQTGFPVPVNNRIALGAACGR